MQAQPRQDITCLKDDDDGFFAWPTQNPDGYVVNSERNPKPSYLILHRPGCRHFKSSNALRWTKDYIKFCSPSRANPEAWATSAIGGEAQLCRSCFG